MAIVLGHTPDGDAVSLDLDMLAQQRLLVQGTSGSGKSGLLRRLLEQTYGKIPQVVIDVEGEFPTLRTAFPDYVLAAHEGGDALAAPHTAGKLAREINAQNISAIIDLSELDIRPRMEFVANYLNTLVNLPRQCWKPVMVVIDEAHEYAPENGSAVSLLPVERLCSKGRKRGIIPVCATTRVADLSKSVTALLNNKLIGKTQQDVDVRRAGQELGVSTREATALLRDLRSRNFVGFGGAFRVNGHDAPGNIQLYVADTRTHPPAAGGELVAPRTPTARMRKVLAKLADLPKEAEREIRDLADAKAVIARLERELKAKPAPERVVETCAHENEMAAMSTRQAKLEERDALLEQEAGHLASALCVARDALRGNADLLDREVKEHAARMKKRPAIPVRVAPQLNDTHAKASTEMLRRQSPAAEHHADVPETPTASVPLSGGALRMVQQLARVYPTGLTPSQLSVLAKVKRSGGSWSTYLSRVRSANMIEERDGLFYLSGHGAESFGVEDQSPKSHAEAVALWRSILSGGALRMFDALYEHGSLSLDELSHYSEISRSGGSFATYLSRLSGPGIARKNGDGKIELTRLLYPEEAA